MQGNMDTIQYWNLTRKCSERAMNASLLCTKSYCIYAFHPDTSWRAISEERLIEKSHLLSYIPEIHASV